MIGTKSAILALCLAAAAHGASVHTTPEASSFTRRLLSNKKGKGNSHKGPKGGNDGHHMNVTQICTEWVNNQSNSTDLGDASTNEALGPDTVLRAGGLDFINPPLCKVGQSQSPIDIRGGGTTNVPAPGAGQLMGPIVFNSWRGVPVNVTQTNHGPKLIYPTSGSDMLTTTVNGVTVSLLQWHAHSPSEHTFDGKNYDAEIHFVHQNLANLEIYVIAAMVEARANATDNVAFEYILDAAQGMAIDQVKSEGASIDPSALLPSPINGQRAYAAYMGSFTTPPCAEGVHWQIFQEPVVISVNQLWRYMQMTGQAKDGYTSFHYFINNRVTQPLNGRTVTYQQFATYHGFTQATNARVATLSTEAVVGPHQTINY